MLPTYDCSMFYETYLRTLINQILSTNLFRILIWNCTVQLLTFVRYVYGPLPSLWCYVMLVLRSSFMLQGLMLLDAMIIVRYSFIFHLKNPTSAQDDFWNFFINLLVTLAGILTQTVYAIQPGKNPLHYYICVGRIPRSQLSNEVKMNYSSLTIVIISSLLHIFTWFRLYLISRKKTLQQDCLNVVINKESLANVTGNLLSVFIILLASAIPNHVNTIDFETLDQHTLLVHIFHHYLPQSMFLYFFVIYYSRNARLRKFLKREFTIRINAVYECKT